MKNAIFPEFKNEPILAPADIVGRCHKARCSQAAFALFHFEFLIFNSFVPRLLKPSPAF
jgi:hypothetical protein